MEHKHNYKLLMYSGVEGTFSCTKCKHKVTRKFTKAERRLIVAEWNKEEKRITKLHTVSHRWQALEKRYVEKKMYYQLMDAAEKFAKKYAADTRLTRIDDNMFMGANLLFIYHRAGDYFMGTSVVVLTQTEKPFHYFMYPGDVREALEALQHADTLAKNHKAEPPLKIAFSSPKKRAKRKCSSVG